MIVVAGLTPAWQTIMRFPRLTLGEVNRAAEVHHFASGKVLNVAVGLAHLNALCKVISPVGGAAHEAIDRELSAWGISRHWIVTDAATRSCVTILEDASDTTTELVENAAPLTADELNEFIQAFRHDALPADAAIITGSLPTGTDHNLIRQLTDGLPCPVILDARGPELLASLVNKPWLVKPNREELAITFGKADVDDATIEWGMRELARLGARHVLVTDGPRPAWFFDGTTFSTLQPPRIPHVINPIGSGDSLAAGFASALVAGRSAIECVRFGIAAAAYNVGTILAARLDLDGINILEKQVVVTRRDH